MHLLGVFLIILLHSEVGVANVIPLTRREYFNRTLLHNAQNSVRFNSNRNLSLHFLQNSAYIDLNNFYNVQYYGTVYVGTPKQPFEVLFDTSSDVTWIPGPNDTSECGASHRKFNPSASRSYVDLNQEIIVNYVQGHNVLRMANEMLTIGDMTINKQQIGLTKTGDCKKYQFDGIMGMSFRNPDRKEIVIVPVFETMVNQQVVPSQIFSFYLNRNGNQGKGGELFLGGWNTKYVNKKEIKYIPILDGPLWKIGIKSIYFGSLMVQPYCEAILDTGSSNIFGPKTSIDRIKIAANGAYLGNTLTVECATINILPPLMFNIDGVDYVYSANDLVLTVDDDLCILNLKYHSDKNSNVWTFGDPFLRKVYSIFDTENRKVALIQMRNDYPIDPTADTLPPITTENYSGGSIFLASFVMVFLGILLAVNVV